MKTINKSKSKYLLVAIISALLIVPTVSFAGEMGSSDSDGRSFQFIPGLVNRNLDDDLIENLLLLDRGLLDRNLLLLNNDLISNSGELNLRNCFRDNLGLVGLLDRHADIEDLTQLCLLQGILR